MSEYTVCGYVKVSCWTKVEASSKEEAIKIAKTRELASFQIDGSYPEDEAFHCDNDGEPSDLMVED